MATSSRVRVGTQKRDTIFGNYKIAAKLAHINDILDDVTEWTYKNENI